MYSLRGFWATNNCSLFSSHARVTKWARTGVVNAATRRIPTFVRTIEGRDNARTVEARKFVRCVRRSLRSCKARVLTVLRFWLEGWLVLTDQSLHL